MLPFTVIFEQRFTFRDDSWVWHIKKKTEVNLRPRDDITNVNPNPNPKKAKLPY